MGIAVVTFFYARSLAFLVRIKSEFRNTPEIWNVPKPLIPDPIAISVAKPPMVSYFGYEFESPTSEVKEEQKTETVVALNFADCAGMAILKPRPSGILAQIIEQGPPETGRNFEEVYGKDAVRSDYVLRQKILNMTPRDLSLFAWPRQITRNSILLMLKGVESQRFKNGLYRFETPSVHGFLEGDLALDPGVVIEAFDHEDHLLTLVVGRKPGKSCFGSSELNRIIFSLRPSPATE